MREPVVRSVTANVCVPAASAAFPGKVAWPSEEVTPTVSVALTGFQFASTALTVTLKEAPEAWPLGEPLLPEALPGAAVSPGRSSWSFAKAPAAIAVDGLVSAVFEPSVWSVAVIVDEPSVGKMIAKVFVPETRAAGAGGVALPSLVLSETVSPALTGFQLASTALTVTLKEAPAVWLLGEPVLPDAVPGAAFSPGSRSCNLANAPALIVVDGLVSAVIEPSVMSVAVNVALPAVFAVTEKFFVPATSAALAGRVALVSLEVMPTVSVELTRFQFASTAFTVTVNDEPAVRAVGAPVLPEAVPGAAVSFGSRSCSFANAPGTIVIAELAAESESESPLVRCATSVSDSALRYCTVESVAELVPAVIVAVLLAIDPVPDGFSISAVSAATLDVLPYASSERTSTEKFAPAVTLPPGTEVTSSLVAAAALTATLSRSAPAADTLPSLAAMVADSTL